MPAAPWPTIVSTSAICKLLPQVRLSESAQGLILTSTYTQQLFCFISFIVLHFLHVLGPITPTTGTGPECELTVETAHSHDSVHPGRMPAADQRRPGRGRRGHDSCDRR